MKDIKINLANGEELKLEDLMGSLLLVVNTASG